MKLKFTILALVLSSCGTLGGSGSTTSSGEQILTGDSVTANFDVSLGQDLYKSFPVVNNTSGILTLFNVLFSNNVCSSFSLYNVINASGQTLAEADSPLNVAIKAGEQIRLNVLFKSQACSYTKNYDTSMTVYLKDKNSKVSAQTMSLHAIGLPPEGSETGDDCSEKAEVPAMEQYYISGVPEPGEYYLQIDKMRAFIFGDGSSIQKTQMAIVGTDVGDLDPDAFDPTPLRVTIGTEGNNNTLILHKISECENFFIPSPPSDIYFKGADTAVTSDNDYPGNFILTESSPLTNDPDIKDFIEKRTDFKIPGVYLTLYAQGIEDASLIKDPITNSFRISLITDLQTTSTEPDGNLGDTFTSVADRLGLDPDKALNRKLVENTTDQYVLMGNPLIDGKMTLVGKAKFDDSKKDFIGEDVARLLIDKTSFTYVQIEVTVMKKISGDSGE